MLNNISAGALVRAHTPASYRSSFHPHPQRRIEIESEKKRGGTAASFVPVISLRELSLPLSLKHTHIHTFTHAPINLVSDLGV